MQTALNVFLHEEGSLPEKKVWIDIDQLTIDPCNVRLGKWECDEADKELVRDVKERMVQNPLRVRPLNLPTKEGKQIYGIVEGGRRFNAAIAAGFTEVPCIIKKWDDTEARIQSLMENRLRKNNPKWMDIEQIGKIIGGMNDKITLESRIGKVSKRSGLSEGIIEKYYDIYTLPEAVRGLIRKPEDRPAWLKEYLLVFQKRKTSETLSIGSAELIAQELRNFPPAKQMEVACFLLDKSHDKAEKLIECVKKRPEEPLGELYEEIITGASKISSIVYLDRETKDALGDACMEKQIYERALISKIIKEWLEKTGYMGEQNEEAGLDELSLQIGRHRVTIFPTIHIDGSSPPTFYSIKEVKEKAWNRNIRLPRQVIEALNNLRLILRSKTRDSIEKWKIRSSKPTESE